MEHSSLYSLHPSLPHYFLCILFFWFSYSGINDWESSWWTQQRKTMKLFFLSEISQVIFLSCPLATWTSTIMEITEAIDLE
jgi:hypothetical protein